MLDPNSPGTGSSVAVVIRNNPIHVPELALQDSHVAVAYLRPQSAGEDTTVHVERMQSDSDGSTLTDSVVLSVKPELEPTPNPYEGKIDD
jgi:hypothetical protein